MNIAIAIFFGGGLGSLARYGVSRISASLFPIAFPYGTLISNGISCLILGLFLGFATLKPEQSNNFRYLIAIGFCGGFSTFSSFSAETIELFKHGSYLYAGLNITANLVLSLTAIAVGAWAMRLLYN